MPLTSIAAGLAVLSIFRGSSKKVDRVIGWLGFGRSKRFINCFTEIFLVDVDFTFKKKMTSSLWETVFFGKKYEL